MNKENKNNKGKLAALLGCLLLIGLLAVALWQEEEITVEKPVIYLYPETEQEVAVQVKLAGELTCTYPNYGEGWAVTARPDGTLTNHADGREYSYLYWEGESQVEYDFSKGFVVKGEDAAAFLEEKLAQLGLTAREANEFIVYWLPKLEANDWNLVTFQQEAYTDAAELIVTPEPDSLLRVFMVFKELDGPIEIEEQELEAFERVGFTVVEWGGSELE